MVDEDHFDLSNTARKNQGEISNILGSANNFEQHNNRESIDMLTSQNNGLEDSKPEEGSLERQETEPPIKKDNYALVSNPVFRRLFALIRYVGCFIAVASIATELAYLFTHRFSSITYWVLYILAVFLKIAISFVMILVAIKRKVISKKPKGFLYDVDQVKREQITK